MSNMKIVLTGDTHNLEGEVFWQNIAKEKPDLVVHAGDWTMDSSEIEDALNRAKMNMKGKQHVLTVLGNHDYWIRPPFDRDIKTLDEGRADRFGGHFHRIEGRVERLGECSIAGFMGWYKEVWPFNVTNDHKFVSQSNWECLQALSDIALQRIMDHDGKIDLLVTHFPLSTSEAKLLSQKVKRVLIGHWHEPVDAEWFGMRIINTGSNYHQPIYKVLEI